MVALSKQCYILVAVVNCWCAQLNKQWRRGLSALVVLTLPLVHSYFSFGAADSSDEQRLCWVVCACMVTSTSSSHAYSLSVGIGLSSKRSVVVASMKISKWMCMGFFLGCVCKQERLPLLLIKHRAHNLRIFFLSGLLCVENYYFCSLSWPFFFTAESLSLSIWAFKEFCEKILSQPYKFCCC